MTVTDRTPRAGGRPPLDLLRQAPVLRASVAVSTAAGLLSSASLVVQALAVADLLSAAMTGGGAEGMTRDLVWLAVSVLVRAGAGLLGEVVAGVGSAVAKAQLREVLARSLVGGGAVASVDGAGVVSVAGRGVDSLEVYFGRCLPGLLTGVLAPLGLVGAVGALDWVSGVVVAVAVLLFPLFGALVGRASMSLAGDRWRQVEALGRSVADVFEGMAVLKALGRSREQRSRLDDANRALREASMATLRLAFTSALVLDTLASVSVALVAVPLGLRLLNGSMGLSAALAVLIVSPEVFLPLRRASAQFHESTEGLAAAGRLLQLTGAVEAPAGPATGAGDERRAALPDGPVGVTLERVRVLFPGRSEPVLDDASLEIRPGERLGVLGPNGAGKSTLLSLVLGFTRPDAGSVVVGGQRMTSLDLAEWRRRVTYLPERPTLLAASLAANLRLARPGASDDELRIALERAGAGELLRDLPDGLGTPLGEGGRPVSAGERQRIALARVFLRPAWLYLLDEPTVHLDSDTEKLVVEELGREIEGRSAVIVTHRSAPAGLADRLVLLRDGLFRPGNDLVAPAAVGSGARR